LRREQGLSWQNDGWKACVVTGRFWPLVSRMQANDAFVDLTRSGWHGQFW
jgi:hypothetical protein